MEHKTTDKCDAVLVFVVPYDIDLDFLALVWGFVVFPRLSVHPCLCCWSHLCFIFVPGCEVPTLNGDNRQFAHAHRNHKFKKKKKKFLIRLFRQRLHCQRLI